MYEGGIRVVSLIRWPEKVPEGSNLEQTMTVMDVFPSLAAAAGIKPQNELEFDGINMMPALLENKEVSRDESIFFASEIPIYNSFGFTAIDGDWKLVQWVTMEPLATTVTHELYNVADDPGEYNNLASEHPRRVGKMAQAILDRRALYPINGTRARIASPPGWHPPKDWASYPRPLSELQNEAATSMAPSARSAISLDYLHGDRGRLIYNCDPLDIPVIGKTCLN